MASASRQVLQRSTLLSPLPVRADINQPEHLSCGIRDRPAPFFHILLRRLYKLTCYNSTKTHWKLPECLHSAKWFTSYVLVRSGASRQSHTQADGEHGPEDIALWGEDTLLIGWQQRGRAFLQVAVAFSEGPNISASPWKAAWRCLSKRHDQPRETN